MKCKLSVIRIPPNKEWLPENIDGASRGNPSLSSIAFCIRNWKSESLVAKGSIIHDTTSLETEAIDIMECLIHYRECAIQYIVVESNS